MVSLRTAIPVYKTSSCYTQWISLRQNIMGGSGLLTTQVRMKWPLKMCLCLCVCVSQQAGGHPDGPLQLPSPVEMKARQRQHPSLLVRPLQHVHSQRIIIMNTIITVMVIIITIIVHNTKENLSDVCFCCVKFSA